MRHAPFLVARVLHSVKQALSFKKKQKVATVLLRKIRGVCVCGGGGGGVRGGVARSHMREQHPKEEKRASDAELLCLDRLESKGLGFLCC